MARDNLKIRAIVLGVLQAYGNPCDESERKIEGLLPLLQHAKTPEIREQAAHASRLWLGTKDRCLNCYRRLIYYRLRHLDNALEKLERMTRPKKKAR